MGTGPRKTSKMLGACSGILLTGTDSYGQVDKEGNEAVGHLLYLVNIRVSSSAYLNFCIVWTMNRDI